MHYEPTAADWADYCEYLDDMGYDHGDDDYDYDPDENHSFQPFTWDYPEDDDDA